MNPYNCPEEALPLVTYNPSTNAYTVNPETLSHLSTFPSPLSILTVTGLYRTGKSFLLNRLLLNKKKGFPVGPSVNPCTKGIWIWSRPL